MHFKSKVLISLFLLLINSTSPAAEITRTDLQDRPLHAGQRAYYSGILVPEYHYRQVSSCLQTLPACESALNDSIKESESFGDKALDFGMGALFGALLYGIFKH